MINPIVGGIKREVVDGYVVVNGQIKQLSEVYIVVNGEKQLVWSRMPQTVIELIQDDIWTVPKGVTSIDIFCVGGAGGSVPDSVYPERTYNNYTRNANNQGATGGSGYTKTALNVAVTPGESLVIIHGAPGGNATSSYTYYNSNGGDGGVTSVKRGSTALCSANGGKGAVGTSRYFMHAGSSSYIGLNRLPKGGDGGSGGEPSQYGEYSSHYVNGWSSSDIDYYYYIGAGYGEDGSDSQPSKYFPSYMTGFRGDSGVSEDYTDQQIINSGMIGTGQGTTTRPFGLEEYNPIDNFINTSYDGYGQVYIRYTIGGA